MKATKKDKLTALMFLIPGSVLYILFVLIPVINIFYYSLLEWDGMGEKVFIGLQNFSIIFHSEPFWTSLANNIKFLLVGVPLWTFIPLFLAILLHEEVKGWKFFRSAFFFPTVLSITVMSTIFRTLFLYNGPVNSVLQFVGVAPIEFWAQGNIAIILICIFITWIGFGSTILLFLAAMSNFSSEIYEASILDGASWWQRVKRVQIPLLKPTLALVIMLNVMSCFSGLFSTIYMMTGGGPGYETTTLEYLLYTSAFKNHDYGYASAVAVVLFLIVLTLGIIQHRFTKTEEDEL